MSIPIFTRNTPNSILINLQTLSGQDALGISHTNVVCQIMREGGPYVNKTLTSTNFSELGGGWYNLELTAVDTSLAGYIYVRFTGVGLKASTTSALVIEEGVIPASALATANLYGYVFGVDGKPKANVSVSARILSNPTVMSSGASAVGVSSEIVSTTTDGDGFFCLNLLVSSVVDVFIPSIGYRRVVTIPAYNSNVFDLP